MLIECGVTGPFFYEHKIVSIVAILQQLVATQPASARVRDQLSQNCLHLSGLCGNEVMVATTCRESLGIELFSFSNQMPAVFVRLFFQIKLSVDK